MALPNDRLGDDILKARRHDVITQGKSEYPIVCHFTDLRTNEGLVSQVLRKNAAPQSASTASQSEDHNASESSSSEVQMNVTPNDHPPRATRSSAARDVLRTLLLSLKRESEDGSGGSVESESGSRENATTPPLAVNIEDETGVWEKADAINKDGEITTNDTIVLYVNIHEPYPTARQQLIDYFHSMWTVNRSEEFFNNGIVIKTGNFKKRAIMPETRVVVDDIKEFPDIYQTFQFHHFD
uniref:Integrase core domain containing protein n=1 Tax=Solanum tuberosum TaxID=4113 RepID=M1DEK6_SOLTU